MAGYRLTQAAADDIAAIYIESHALFGLAQADKYHAGLTSAFAFLSDFPRAARLREEIAPPVRAYRFRAHMILYDLTDGNTVTVLRVRHGREDWLVNDEVD